MIGKFTEFLLLHVQRTRLEERFLATVTVAEAALVDFEMMEKPLEQYTQAKKYYGLTAMPYMKEEEEAKAEYMKKKLKEITSEGPLRVIPLASDKKGKVQNARRALSQMRKQQSKE